MSEPARAAGDWVRACSLTEIEQGRPAHTDISGCPVCLVRTSGTVYALRDECTHQSVPLSEGEVADGAIECWLHGSRFDLATGRALSPPATRPVAVFAVRVEGGDIYVSLSPDRASGTGTRGGCAPAEPPRARWARAPRIGPAAAHRRAWHDGSRRACRAAAERRRAVGR